MQHRVWAHLLVSLAASASVCTSAAAQTHSAEAKARAVHVLNRLTFGPRPGDVQRLLARGVDSWIEEQLHPDRIEDDAGAVALSACPLWTLPVEQSQERFAELVQLPYESPQRFVRVGGGVLALIQRDSARKTRFAPFYLENTRLASCRLRRIEASELQLLEVMTDFWANHFSVYAPSMPSRSWFVVWDRAVIRTNALGRFRDLLGAVAHSPVMLNYLDNDANSAGRLNENYARELLELHTLGVDGGYAQADVEAVARTLTGWTHTGTPQGCTGMFNARTGMQVGGSCNLLAEPRISFQFDSTRHDTEVKVLLGRTLPAGRGMKDGEELLDVLASHPSTARFIARKLATRFVSDSPPPALVERAAQVYLRTDGDIRSVVRTIVTSPEFFAPNARGVKIKSPIELVLSARRALGAPVDTAGEVVDLLIEMDQTPFGHLTPDGWPERGTEWINTGSLLKRINLAARIADDDVTSIPVATWPRWAALVGAPFERQVTGVIDILVQGQASPRLRNALAGERPSTSTEPAEESLQTLRDLIAIVLASSDFQSR